VDLLPDPKALVLVPPAGELLTGRVRFEVLVTRPDVAKVELSVDGVRAATADHAPFEGRVDLGDLPRPRTVEAVAFDAAGGELGRDSVVVNQGAGSFRVRLIEPRRSDQVGPVDVEAEVSLRPDDRLDRVEIAWNNELVATLYAPPFRQRLEVPPEQPVGYIAVTAYLADGSSAEDVAFMNGPGGDERLDVQLVELYTVVEDPTGRPVRGLGKNDFRVWDREREQEVAEVKDGSELPLSLGLLLDSSASMADVLRDTEIAAIDFLFLTLGEGDRAMLVDFDSQPRLAQPLTSDLDAVGREVVRLEADGYTALCDALVFSLVQMQTVHGRRALVVLSDGVGREERVGYATCLRLAQQVGIPIYAIVLDRDGDERSRSEKIDKITAAVGGRTLYVRSLENLGSVYRTIRDELRSQYLVTYYPRDTGGEDWRPVEVEIRQPGLTARTVSGYWP
jgi:VWFA-related protein